MDVRVGGPLTPMSPPNLITFGRFREGVRHELAVEQSDDGLRIVDREEGKDVADEVARERGRRVRVAVDLGRCSRLGVSCCRQGPSLSNSPCSCCCSGALSSIVRAARRAR